MPLPLLLSFLFLLVLPAPVQPAVELGRQGQPPVRLTEVYLHEGTPYLAIDEVLSALSLHGNWDSVEHLFRIQSPGGVAVISPGSRYLRVGNTFLALGDRPRFIDGRLRVPEDLVRSRLSPLLGEPVHYVNLDPPPAPEAETPLDRLFSFLLRKSGREKTETLLRGVVIDPGHGGQDPGAIGPGGEKEEAITLEVGRKLEKLLKMRLGVPVHLTRTGDYELGQQQRFEAAARPDIEALILLHVQASLASAPQGVTLVIRPREEAAADAPVAGEGESMRLARQLALSLVQRGIEVRGIVRAPLVPLGRGDLPTVLVELGYLSNPQDLALLRDPAGQERLSEALYEGLRNFAEEPMKENVTWSR